MLWYISVSNMNVVVSNWLPGIFSIKTKISTAPKTAEDNAHLDFMSLCVLLGKQENTIGY